MSITLNMSIFLQFANFTAMFVLGLFVVGIAYTISFMILRLFIKDTDDIIAKTFAIIIAFTYTIQLMKWLIDKLYGGNILF